MTLPKRSGFLIACMALCALEMAAQPQSWDNVKTISPGTEIRIAGPRPGTVHETLESATGDSLALNSSVGQETFTRQQVTRVSVKKQAIAGGTR